MNKSLQYPNRKYFDQNKIFHLATPPTSAFIPNPSWSYNPVGHTPNLWCYFVPNLITKIS